MSAKSGFGVKGRALGYSGGVVGWGVSSTVSRGKMSEGLHSGTTAIFSMSTL